MNTIPYTDATEALDQTLAETIDRLQADTDLDVITETEAESLQDYIDDLEAIRGKLNHA